MHPLLEGLAELCFPTRCAGCELPGHLLCPDCRDALPAIDPAHACPRCAAPHGSLVCTECWDRTFAFEAAVALGELAIPLSRAIVLHKDAGERRLSAVLGSLLAEKTAHEWPSWPEAVAFVPATSAALRKRGFDHAEAIARACADTLGMPLLGVLARDRALDQRRLGRSERLAQARGSFSAAETCGRVLIVDDVLTTGATLDAAASALLDSGAEAVRVAVLARAW